MSTDSLLNEVCQLTLPVVQQYGVSLTLDDGAQTTLTTERHQVVQILDNLVRNAAESLQSCPYARTVTLSTSMAGDQICIRVADNGPGIPNDKRDAIFQYGFTTKAAGSGFGLHVSALAARNLGGHLVLDPAHPNTGARFSLHLPLEPVMGPPMSLPPEVRSECA